MRAFASVAAAFLAGLSAAAAQQTDPAPADADATSDEAFFSIDSPVGAIEYVAGRGLHLGRTGLTLGGFSTLEIDREEGQAGVVQLDNVSFLVLFQPIDALRGFAEIELGDLFQIETNSDDVRSDPKVDIERLYGDLSRSDALNLRFGKFQTPVGRWNLAPAEPFVWTATDPVLVDRAFDEHQTGVALFGSLYPESPAKRSLTWWLYGQVLDPLDPPRGPDPVDRTAGGRLELGGPVDDWSLGASFLASERRSDWNFLGGVDAAVRVGPVELQSEFALVEGDIPDRNLWGVYAQGVYGLGHAHPVLDGVYLVARYEHFDPAGWSRNADLGDVGITWLPASFLNLKAGYRFSNRETDEVSRGLFASVSLLF